MSAWPPLATALPKSFFVRTIYPYDPPAPASAEGILGFDKGELALIHHVEPSGWAECRLLKCGSIGWIPLNYCNVFDPRPMRPLLKAVIKFTGALRLASDVSVVSYVEGGDIDAIVHGVSKIMILAYRLNANYPEIGAWKVLLPIARCVHGRVLVLRRHLGTMRERTSSQGNKDTIDKIDLVSAALEIVLKADTFLSTIQELHESHACRSLINTESPSTVENGSKTFPPAAAVDASDEEPDSPLSKGLGKHMHAAYLAPTSSHGFTEHKLLLETQKREERHDDLRDSDSKAQLEQHPMHRPDNIPPQPPGHHLTLTPDQWFSGRAQRTRCSLQALIEHLTNCDSQSVREQFVATFLITWELFCTTEELLNALTKRFIDAPDEEPQQRKRIRFLVCYALRVWLESFCLHILLWLERL
ncbi:Ras guanine-nucleotide exchange [Fusarium mexicanum]|uniref:Ras guanine-nucleotide exchange n=1 Tax=Fusarium mexicanum TaxID=751941 RepID=A0A8H5MXH5_9HYPO|nr:Ras guanine-nucleotide exchange [Fusarium mexicanum]